MALFYRIFKERGRVNRSVTQLHAIVQHTLRPPDRQGSAAVLRREGVRGRQLWEGTFLHSAHRIT